MTEQAKTIVSWDDLDAMVGTLAEKVGGDYDVVLVITRGGLVPAGDSQAALERLHRVSVNRSAPVSEEVEAM